ncbi:jg8428 [Pararge aegeria aegeria]|uniref:Jg8428 protein n=1 Tax=Pararge aegeria aegeria TaxID=348720 RepID=A0A8S4SKX6_9NEOP|nr:jg8428 [Pararge aegeria aegeria]
MQGLSIQSLKKHKALIPLYVCVGLGCGASLFYIIRLATRSPDVSWNKRTNPEPWQEYRNKQYKVCLCRIFRNDKSAGVLCIL